MIRQTNRHNLGWFAAAAPWIAQGIAVGLQAVMGRKGGARRIAATDLVNVVYPELEKNLAEYLAGPRTPQAQVFHLGQFDYAWNWLLSPEGCGTPTLGQAGRRCISDRDRGGQHDWWAEFRDPIANDPDVKPDPPLTTQITEQARRVLGPILPQASSMTTVLIGLALIAGGLMLTRAGGSK